jgi:hypothetical protein
MMRYLTVLVMTMANAATIAAPSVALTVGGKTLDVSGPPDCTHTRDGSIYNVPAAIWSVRQTLAKGSLSLTLFQPIKGGDMITIMVALDGKVHQVSTVKIGTNGTIRGSGTIRVMPTSSGGRFAIDATASDGLRIRGTIVCSRFALPQDNG